MSHNTRIFRRPLLAGALTLAALGASPSGRAQSSDDSAAMNMAGEHVRLADFAGRHALLMFGPTW